MTENDCCRYRIPNVNNAIGKNAFLTSILEKYGDGAGNTVEENRIRYLPSVL